MAPAHAPALAALFKALGDETRLRMLSLLAQRELCVCEFLARFPLSQSCISHHLKVLRQAGLVQEVRHGKWTVHRIRPEALQAASSQLAQWQAAPLPWDSRSALAHGALLKKETP